MFVSITKLCQMAQALSAIIGVVKPKLKGRYLNFLEKMDTIITITATVLVAVASLTKNAVTFGPLVFI